ncbi:hypothetical protein ACIBCH_09730 [Amycolatopsis thailandensis]|uniref:hypothetical protein n=1 Tax=Amycolatopsis thailandensis TaxID=589330 RepID=UPI0037876758
MSIDPAITAGYEATKKILADKPLHQIEHVGQRLRRLPTDPMGLLNSFPPAYTVQVMVLPEGANLIRNSKYGFLDETNLVTWPVPTDAPDFEAKLAEVLVPAVDEFLRKASEDKAAKTAKDPNSSHESRDQIRRIS